MKTVLRLKHFNLKPFEHKSKSKTSHKNLRSKRCTLYAVSCLHADVNSNQDVWTKFRFDMTPF